MRKGTLIMTVNNDAFVYAKPSTPMMFVVWCPMCGQAQTRVSLAEMVYMLNSPEGGLCIDCEGDETVEVELLDITERLT